MTFAGESISSEELAKQAQQGDFRALDDLIRRHKSEAYRVALRMCGRPFDAEEILQVSLERMFKHIKHYDPTRAFRPWLFGIVLNQARTHFKKQKLKSLFLFDFSLTAAEPSNASSSDALLRRKEVKEVVEMALMSLSVELREAFVFKHIEGLSFEEMSEATGSSQGALRVRAHRARQLVMKFLLDRDVTLSHLTE